jgi:hypothetical protein
MLQRLLARYTVCVSVVLTHTHTSALVLYCATCACLCTTTTTTVSKHQGARVLIGQPLMLRLTRMWLSPVMAAAAAVTTAVAAGNDAAATAAREQAVAEFGVAIDRAAAGQTQWRQFGQELITEVDRVGMVSCSVVYYVRTTSTAREECYHCYASAAVVPLLATTCAAPRLLCFTAGCVAVRALLQVLLGHAASMR